MISSSVSDRTHVRVTALPDRHAFIRISDRVAVITQALKRPGKGGRRARLVSAYIGCSSQSAANAIAVGIKRYFSKAYCEVRRAQRLATEWEVKIRYFAENSLESFIWSYAKNPAIISSDSITPNEAKRSIFPPDIEPITPVQPLRVRPIELAPLQPRSNRPQKVGQLAID